MPNLLNHSTDRRVIHDADRVSNSAKPQTTHDQCLTLVIADRASHQRYPDSFRSFVSFSASHPLAPLADVVIKAVL